MGKIYQILVPPPPTQMIIHIFLTPHSLKVQPKLRYISSNRCQFCGIMMEKHIAMTAKYYLSELVGEIS